MAGWCYHQGAVGYLRASHASMPHVRPAQPIAKPSDASTGTSSSQIHAVPHSEIHRLARKRDATVAAGRVNSPSVSRTPSEISVTACAGAAIDALLAAKAITAFQAGGT